MRMDAEGKKDEFKNQIFAHAFANQNPDLFYAMYPEYAQRGGHPSQGVEEWEVPRSEDELREMMSRWNVHRVS